MKSLHKSIEGKKCTTKNVEDLQRLVDFKLTSNFTFFLLEYSNTGISEHFYFFNKNLYILSFVLPVASGDINIIELAQEFIEEYKFKYIPFGIDPGGWHFCISLDENTYNEVFINRWTDDFSDGQFLRISDSFESFIDGLLTEKDAIDKGYKV